jgi:mono/diheme cytochrome c family protein
MRFLTYVSALLTVGIIAGCTSLGNGAGQDTVPTSADMSIVERSFDQPSYTPTPAATSTMPPTATMTKVVEPPIQPVTPAQESITEPAQTPSVTLAVTATRAASATPTQAASATASASNTSSTGTRFTTGSDVLAEQGLKVYQAQYCGICHQLDAAGTAGLFGPTHNGLAQTAEERLGDPLYTGSARTAGEYVRESILNPESYLVPGYELSNHRMPAYVNLSEKDLEALVQLLLQQK